MPQPDPLDHEKVLSAAIGAGAAKATPDVPSLARLEPHFPGLRLVRCIGRGGMAAVYEAVQTSLGRRVALKVLLPELAKSPEFGERFLREARALASLSHPNVLTVFEVGESGGWFWLLTELVDGASLRELMELGRLSPREALRIVPQICAGLQFAHDRGVVHRDVKPENILIDAHGHVKIADFGLAKVASRDGAASLTRTSMVFGTPHYMAPEQWRGSHAVDHRADIYALGVVFYEMLTGELPVGRFAPPSQRAAVSPRVDEVVHRALESEPDARYQTAREIQRDVESEANALPDAAAPAPRADAAPATSARIALLPIVAIALLALSLLGLLGMLGHETQNMARHREVEAQLARDAALLDAIRASVEAGRAWTGELPAADGGQYATDTIPPRRLVAIAIAWALGTVVLTTLLGLLSQIRIRSRPHELRGWLLARAATTLPLVMLADAAALLALSSGAFRSEAVAMFGVGVILFGNVGWVAWLVHGARRMPPPIEPLPCTRGMLAGIVIAALVVAGAVWSAATAPRSEQLPLDTQRPTPATELRGLSPAQVVRRLGPPLAIGVDRESMSWDYRGIDGRHIAGAVRFVAGNAVPFDQSRVPLVPNRTPATGPWLGQAIADLVAELGEPRRSNAGAIGLELEFENGARATIAEGVVVTVHD